MPLSCGRWPNPRSSPPSGPGAGNWRLSSTPQAGGRSACCFICGAPASLGELQGNEQAKHLRCGQCGADWLIRRLQCIYCGNEDPSLLGILSPEGRRENVRVEVCDKCHGYLKVVSRFAPCSPEELAVEDLSTLYLDCLAQERGYRRAST